MSEINSDQYEALTVWLHDNSRIPMPRAYWIIDDPDNAYCHEHIPQGTEIEFFGYPSTEEDVPIFCTLCKQMLAHTLTDHGAETELKYYEENGWGGTKNERYTLVNIGGGYPPSHQARLCKILEISG